MPTYEYRCKACGEHLEVVQSFTDDPLTECPSCSGDLRKVFGSIGIAFKGSGFYKTDSRSGSARSTTPSPSGDSSSGNGSSEGASTSTSSSSDSSSPGSSSSDSSSAGGGSSNGSEAKSA